MKKVPGIKYLFPFTLDEERKAKYLLAKYGLEAHAYVKMLEDQNNLCAICECDNNEKPLVVDHCHSTNIVRGLLCNNCNTGLGFFKDNTYSLRRAIKYLEKSLD